MPDTSTLIAESRKFLLSGQNLDALRVAEQVLQQEPTNYTALMIAGNAQEQSDNFVAAITLYERALEVQPGQEAIIRLRACVKMQWKLSGRDGDGYLNEFSEKERDVYEKLLEPFKGREVPLKIESKPSKDEDPTKSYFGGAPYAEASDSWPECNTCHRARNFVGQLRWDPSVNNYNLGTFSTNWLFTLFCCFDCVRRKAPDAAIVRGYESPDHKRAKAITAGTESCLPALERFDVKQETPRITKPTKRMLEQMKDRSDLACIPLSYLIEFDRKSDEEDREDSVVLGGLLLPQDGSKIMVANLQLPVAFKIYCSPDSPAHSTVVYR